MEITHYKSPAQWGDQTNDEEGAIWVSVEKGSPPQTKLEIRFLKVYNTNFKIVKYH